MKHLLLIGALGLTLAVSACKKNETSNKPLEETDIAASEIASEAMPDVMTPYSAQDLKIMRTEANRFMRVNGSREGIVKTASGLQYEIIEGGDASAASPKATDIVQVHYEGRLINGEVFDSSFVGGNPIKFPLNRVIPGWTEGLQLMKPGAEYNFFIPPELAYGADGRPGIPPHAPLIFRVMLLDVVTPPAPED